MNRASTGRDPLRYRFVPVTPFALFRRWYLALPAIVLLLAIALQIVRPLQETARPKPPHLTEFVPLRVAGWRGMDIPLGPNEAVSDAVERTLRYDDVINRDYRRGDLEFGVYAAYWGPGRMPTRLVASHTPDRCWTENGFQCLAMRFDERRSVKGVPLQSADWREFRDPDGDTTYVMFWHLIEGKAHDYGERFNKIPQPLEWWRDVVRQAIHGSREQYFIRVTSSVPFDRIWEDPGFTEVMSGLARLGLAEPGRQRPE